MIWWLTAFNVVVMCLNVLLAVRARMWILTRDVAPVEKHGYELGSDGPPWDRLPPVRNPEGRA